MTAPRSGPHQLLLAVYALFTLAAGARATVQLAVDPGRAPVAYGLSLVAAVTYALGWWAIRRAAAGRTGFAARMLWVELAGVLVVGTLSVVRHDLFPDPSVWSDFGIGYGFVPAVLPVAGLLWVRRQRVGARGAASAASASGAADGWIVAAFRVAAFAEAASWLGLLVGMAVKYAGSGSERGVQVFGPVHGTVFLVYVALALVTAALQRWSWGTTLLALAASVPPGGTVVFEVWASRSGRLDARRRPAPTAGSVRASASSAPR